MQWMGLIIGGLIPAVVFGIGNVCSKLSAQAGIGMPWFMILTGLAVTAVGIVSYLIVPDHAVSLRSGLYAAGLGLFWGLGTALVAIALIKYKTPLSTIVPLYNMNTLVAVLASLVIFAEWQQVTVWKLLLGAVLVVVGGTLVALA